jgi:ABC-type amino acid transport substrate-binding protein
MFQGDASASAKFTIVLYNEADEMIDDIARGKIQFGFTDTPFARAAELQYGTQEINFKELLHDEDFPPKIDKERRTEKYAV